MQKTIVITGVAGLLGSNLAKYILVNHPEYDVVGIDNLFGGLKENIIQNSEHYRFYNCDVASDDLISIFEVHHPTYVFHLAAYAAEGLSPFMRKFNTINNTVSTANIVNCCIEYDVQRLVYTSSMSVYGEGIIGERFDETLTPAPIDPYAVSKYSCEMDIQIAGKQHNLDWCIIRPHNVYGVGQNIFDKYRNVLGIWMYQALNDMPLTIYGDGLQTRAFSSIDNILPCLWAAATYDKASKQIVNVGGTTPYTISDACECLRSIIDKETTVVHKEPRYEVKHAIPTFQKSIDILDYDQNENLNDGLTKMWNWAKTLEMRERFKWPKYEITKGIYSYWK